MEEYKKEFSDGTLIQLPEEFLIDHLGNPYTGKYLVKPNPHGYFVMFERPIEQSI